MRAAARRSALAARPHNAGERHETRMTRPPVAFIHLLALVQRLDNPVSETGMVGHTDFGLGNVPDSVFDGNALACRPISTGRC